MKKTLKNKKIIKNQKGAAALLLVLILTISGLSMALSATELGLDDMVMSYASEQSQEALGLAESCAEDTLNHLRRNINYKIGAGIINLNFPEGSCSFEVLDLGDNQRRIEATGALGDYSKSLIIEADLSGETIDLIIWKEN